MIGKRVYFKLGDNFVLEPGQYAKHPKSNIWYACTPNNHTSNLGNHQVTEHDDGSITVSPSILVTRMYTAKANEELWHGFLEKGVWREC